MSEMDLNFGLPSGSNPDAVAAALRERLAAEGVRYRWWKGDFYRWTGTHWARLSEDELFNDTWRLLATGFSRNTGDPWNPTPYKVRNVLTALRAQVAVPEAVEPPAWLDGNGSGLDPRELVATTTGLLNLPTRDLGPNTPDLFNTWALPFAYKPDATAPRWELFLREVWGDTPEQIDALMRFVGYVLSGSTREDKILLLLGPTRSGKGTTATVLEWLVGEENTASASFSHLARNFGAQELIGKPLAIAPDARISGRNVALVERLLSFAGRDKVVIDRKNRDPWTGRLSTRFVVLSNEIPELPDTSRAIATRFVVVRTFREFVEDRDEQEKDLRDALAAELPGILNWALAGYDRYRLDGLRTDVNRDVVEDVAALASPVSTFVAERCVVEPGAEVAKDDLYSAYRGWCYAAGIDRPVAKEVFSRDLYAAAPGVREARHLRDGKRSRYFTGIRLDDGGQNADEPRAPTPVAVPR